MAHARDISVVGPRADAVCCDCCLRRLHFERVQYSRVDVPSYSARRVEVPLRDGLVELPGGDSADEDVRDVAWEWLAAPDRPWGESEQR